jgi:formate hydrogenlyase transcriptional activator
VASTDSTVLLLGETGTGKELVARAIHKLSPRHERMFVRMSVAALPPSLFESELFGHEKGAFTGAVASRIGRLELAHRGTLFLDEVGDIPMEVQPKLLRVLQEREFERLGSTRTQRVDVRVVAATNRDLDRMVEEGTFRSDLYYRLNVFPIAIPPLRERVEDMPALALHFVQQCSRRLGRPIPSIPDGVMQSLKKWRWPGNIRELQNVIERAVIVSAGQTLAIPPQDLQSKSREAHSTGKAAPGTFQDAERETILGALRESGGVVAGPSGAAARLGLRRTTLQSKMRRLGIQRPSY